MKFDYEVLTYVTILALFLISTILSLSRLSVQSDMLIVGLASTLTIYTIAILLLRSLRPRLRRFKFGLSGVEVDLRELEEEALEVKEEETPQKIKEEIDEIQKSDRSPSIVFLELIVEVERKLRMIAESRDFSGYKYVPVPRLVSGLVEKEVIKKELGDLIRRFWQIRNKIVHGVVDITDRNLKDATSIGEVILTELDKVYEKTKIYRLEVECKTCGTRFFSGFSTTKSAFQSSIYQNNVHRCPSGHEHPYNKEDYILVDC